MQNNSNLVPGKIIFIFLCSFLIPIFSYSSFSNIRIVNPSPTDILLTGQDLNIQWVGNYNNAPVNLYYSKDGGNNWLLISDSILNNFYDWKIPILDTLSLQFKVKTSYQVPPYLLWEISQAHQSEIRSIMFSSDSKYFLTAGQDFYVKLWDVNTQLVIDSLNLPGRAIWNASFSHGIDTVVIAVDSSAIVWDRKGMTVKNYGMGDFKKQTRWCAVNPVQDVFAVVSYDGNVRLYSITSGNPVSVFTSIDTSEVYSVAFSKDGKYLAFGGYPGDEYLYDWQNSVLLNRFVSTNRSGSSLIWSCDISPDNQLLAAGGVDSLTRVWNIQSGLVQDSMTGHFGHKRSVLFHPSGKYLMTGSLDGFVKQWDLSTALEVTNAIPHKGAVLSTSYSITGDSILTTGRDSTVKLWKNFEYFNFSDSLKCIVKYPISVLIPDMYSKVGNRINIPLLYQNSLSVPGIQNKIFNADCQIEFPSELLDIKSQLNKTNSLTPKDTISISFQNINLTDTLINISALVLQGDISRDDIKILKFQFVNDTNYVIQKFNGSINIEEYCVGSSSKALIFTNAGASVSINPNPVTNDAKVQMNIIEDGSYKIEILDLHGKIKTIFYGRNLKHDFYEFNINLNDFGNGNYFIIVETPTERIYKSFVVFR
ncbi:MAG: T9SS type A sorting domain-containing protein [FCB group bacterium]|jgi:WD40 repeat protein